MGSRHKATEREPVLWQTLSPSALAAPVGSLRIACVLSLQGVLVTGMRGTSSCPLMQELAKGISFPGVPPCLGDSSGIYTSV